jgi:hypothetical protein
MPDLKSDFARPETRFPIPFMCETGTKTVLIYFSQLESELLHESKEPPNTGYYHGTEEYPQFIIKQCSIP